MYILMPAQGAVTILGVKGKGANAKPGHGIQRGWLLWVLARMCSRPRSFEEVLDDTA